MQYFKNIFTAGIVLIIDSVFTAYNLWVKGQSAFARIHAPEALKDVIGWGVIIWKKYWNN